MVPCVVFEEPDRAREEAGGDEVKEAGANHQEDLELCCVATARTSSAIVNVSTMTHGSLPIDQIPNCTTSSQATDDSKRKRRSRQTQTNTSNENHSFQSLPKHRDKRQQKHSILLTPLLKPRPRTPLDLLIILLQRHRNLHPPLVLQLGHAKQRRAHHGDNNRSEQTEDTFPDVFGAREVVFAKAVEGADQPAADDEADCEPEGDADPDLSD